MRGATGIAAATPAADCPRTSLPRESPIGSHLTIPPTPANRSTAARSDSGRLTTKRISKTESVQSVTRNRFRDTDLRVGPSDYVPWLKDRKVAFIRMEGRLFGGAPVNVIIEQRSFHSRGFMFATPKKIIFAIRFFMKLRMP